MQTDRHGEAYGRFSQLCEHVWTFEVCTSWTTVKQNNRLYIAMNMVRLYSLDGLVHSHYFFWVALLLKGAFLNPPLIVHCEVHTIDSFSVSSPLARIYRPQIIFPYVLLSAILPSHFHIEGGLYLVITHRNVYSFLAPIIFRAK